MPNPESLIEERHKTHGSFQTNAEISQRLKRVIGANSAWGKYTDVQKEVLDMICLKLSRIISGRSNEPDHWRDIAGYAVLAAQELEERADFLYRISEELWIDPPSGWRYGFPKQLPEDFTEEGFDLRLWLVDQGYPENDIDLALKHSRYGTEEDSNALYSE